MHKVLAITLFFLACWTPCLIAQESVRISVEETAGITRTLEPVTLGIPFPKGMRNDLNGLGIQAQNGVDIPAQFSVMARWRDGSIRWVKTDFQANASANGTTEFQLKENSSFSFSSPLSVQENGQKITVNTGRIQFKVSKTAYRLLEEVALDLNQNGAYEANEFNVQQGTNDGITAEQSGISYTAHGGNLLQVSVEEQGPLRLPKESIETLRQGQRTAVL